MKSINKISLLVLFVLLFFEFVRGQLLTDARSLGMAGSNLAVTEGIEHVGGNPATLGKRRDFSFEFHVFSLRTMLKNNSFSLNEYDRYFTTGDSLTSSEIDDLLGHIPDSGFRADMEMGAKAFSIYCYPFSLSLSAMGNGFINLPRSPFEIPFYGNKNVDEYRLDDIKGEAWGGAAASFALAIPMTRYFNGAFDHFSFGIAPKYIFGLQYGKISSAGGSIVTTDDYILINGSVEAIRSQGGSAFSADAGVLAEFQDKWTVSLSASNILGSMKWNRENEISFFEFSSDTIQINDADSLDFYDSDTTLAYQDFTTALPRLLNVGLAFRPNKKLLFTAAWQQGLNQSMGNPTKPLFAFGTEYKFLIFPLRVGYAVGGKNGQAIGLGTGIDLKYWQLNFGYLNHNFKWGRSSKSVELALNTLFRF